MATRNANGNGNAQEARGKMFSHMSNYARGTGGHIRSAGLYTGDHAGGPQARAQERDVVTAGRGGPNRKKQSGNTNLVHY